MSFKDWLESKGYMDGYGTDYQDAYDEGFDEGAKSQQTKIDELQIKIAFQEKAIKNIKLQFENKQIDCDRSDRKIDELQARIDETLIEMKNQLGDEDFCDMQRPDYDAMLYALRNIKDILKAVEK